MQINDIDINQAFEFYNVDKKYKARCYECITNIYNNEKYKNAFEEVYKILYYDNFKNIKQLWDIKNIDEFFIDGIDPFVTNVMIILGYKVHFQNMKKYNFDEEQIKIHKYRVRECFENDLLRRNYSGVRISQMLWTIYFIRTRIIEIGRLQYECENNDEKIVKIHIPRGSKLDIEYVQESITNSKSQLEKVFNISNCKYVCNSWLLSNQIYQIVDKNTNISKFHKLFNVDDGDNCIKDILNFVYELDECEDYSLLPENTTLQKQVKQQLLNGNKFYLGLGTLK